MNRFDISAENTRVIRAVTKVFRVLACSKNVCLSNLAQLSLKYIMFY